MRERENYQRREVAGEVDLSRWKGSDTGRSGFRPGKARVSRLFGSD